MSTKKRILFVDDEPAILLGLQNLLYKDRKRWEMVFASGGGHALDEISKQPFDVVVTDMRMPGIDGATLLTEIKARCPATARIMLSGYAERDSIARVLPAVHQLLAKPCDTRILRGAIERGLELTVSRDPAGALIGHLDMLPSAPAVHAELRCALDTKHCRLDDVEAIVKSDPGLAAKVLQLVNSAYFGPGQVTASIPHAVRLLGLDQMRSIATVFSAAAHDAPEVVALQAHAVATATLAGKLVPEHAERAFAAGLLHDVGHVVLVGHVESGLDHAEVGACLLGVWGLPSDLVQIVRHHHSPDAAPPEQRLVTTAVHVADAIVHGRPVDHDLLERGGYLDRLSAWIAIADGSRLP